MARSVRSAAREGTYKRLVCIVEGHGEVEAVPTLCALILKHVNARGWAVDPDPIRQPRSRLVDHGIAAPRRPPHQDGLSRAVQLALARPADGVLILCDSDDDCPACWGPSAKKLVGARTRAGAIMAVREFETWLLISAQRPSASEAKTLEGIRDAKKRLRLLRGTYHPTWDQQTLTASLDVNTVRACSDSFDSLVRAVAEILDVDCPPRPPWPEK